MADLDAAPAPTDELNRSSSRDPTPHAEHEAPAADDLSLADLSTNRPAAVDDSANTLADGDSNTETRESATADSLGKSATVKAKVASAVKSAAAKPNGAAAGVKKILNSGTFGASKSVSSKPAPSAAALKPAAAPLKKSTSGPAATTSKPTMSTAKPAATAAGTAAVRRTSLAPSSKPSVPGLSKPSLSASAASNLKPPVSASVASNPTTTSGVTTARGSAVSPAGVAPANGKSAAQISSRPRASVSDGVKRTPLTARQSLSAATKPVTTTATRAPATKAAPSAATKRAPDSISSIKEVQEDAKGLEDLQTKLREATESLEAKAGAAAELEKMVDELRASLTAALAEVEAKTSTAAELTEAKTASESQRRETMEVLEKLRVDHQEAISSLQSIQQELEAARIAAVAQQDSVKSLQTQIQSLEAEVAKSKENFDSLQASQPATSVPSAAAAVEQEALLKAQSDFSAIQAEIQAQKDAHAQTLEEHRAKLEAAESKADLAQSLEAQLADLKSQKEEAVAKLSEIEVEVLELKESQETFDDERVKMADRIASLEQELALASVATQQAVDSAKEKEAEYVSRADGLKTSHEAALKAVSEAHEQTTAQLETLRAELEAALASHQVAAADHALQLSEAEKGHLKKQADLSDEMLRIKAELEGQEAQYNGKVDAIKAEHGKLLEEAFQRAKAEAGDVHQQDLKALRAESGSTIEQVRAVHEATLNDLRLEHAAALESAVGDVGKQITKLNLELKATQDDLAKAKANLEAARSEVDTLTVQRDEARAALAATPQRSPEHTEEVARVTGELAVTKDDLQAVTEMLQLTKASLEEMSNNHVTELEEAAIRRAEEVAKLRAAHDSEVTALATQKSDLISKLSDLEGELATLKALVDAQTPAPKSNGAMVHSQSPGITKEELQQMHEAHNLKVHDLQAEHEKAVKGVKEELGASENTVDELKADVARKAMEIQYLESEQDEQNDRITRLQEDLEAATNRIKSLEAAP